MKKILMLLTMLVGTLAAQAEDYTYLTFETTDGAKASVSVASDVTLTISGTTLTVGSQSFTLTNLSKMYFSTSDETTTGISEVMKADLDEATEIYDLQGHKVSKDQMRRGVYVIKTKQGTFKLNVK
jgi:ethanolamine utilization protein EutA (predicted chaperonin)